MNILIGVVPYGRDNVGDEAILATIVYCLREAVPNAKITVSTDEPHNTAEKLGVRTVPLYGHQEPTYEYSDLVHEIKMADLFVWGGATGLSDYPHVGLRMAKLAFKCDTKLILYSVGMNNKLNPAFFRLNSGMKKSLLLLLSLFAFNRVDFVGIYQKAKVRSMRKKIKRVIDKAELIICRDNSSKRELERCGVTSKVYSTADPAILLELCDKCRLEQIWLDQELWQDDMRIIGLCISAQRPINQIDELVDFADYLVEEYDAHILFIPMNPITDSKLMGDLMQKMKNSSRAKVLTGRYEPEEISAVASRMSLIISSRLHLLILSSCSLVPIAGLSRGTKIDNFLHLFGEKACGSVEHIDFTLLKSTCGRLMNDPRSYRSNAQKVVSELKMKASENINLVRETSNLLE